MSETSGPPNGPSDKDGRAPTPAGGVPAADGHLRPSENTLTGFHQVQQIHREHVPLNPTGKRLAVLSLGALGVVYGDIGTSPLYAMQAAFNSQHGSHAFP